MASNGLLTIGVAVLILKGKTWKQQNTLKPQAHSSPQHTIIQRKQSMLENWLG